MKKVLALILALVMVLAMAACSGETSAPAQNTQQNTDSNANANTGADTNANTETPAAKSFQFEGVYSEDGGNASMMTAAFLCNLNADNSVEIDRYRYLTYDDSDMAENSGYEAGFMKGTWKEVEKDGVPCLQIKVYVENDDGTTANDQTIYAYDIAGVYSFDLTFPIVKGMSYSRNVSMEGSETKTYADGNAFIAAYKVEFVAPDHVAEFVTDDGSATLYVQEDGTALFYVGKDKAAEGKMSATDDGLSLKLGSDDVAVTVDGNSASFAYSRDRGDGQMVDYTLSCDDISAIAAAAPAEVAENVYTAPFDLGGNAFDGVLTLVDDTHATLTVAMPMNCTYEMAGSAVVLTVDGELEGYAASIWGAISHAYILNEDHTMTAIKGAYNTDTGLVLYLLDDENMKAEYPAYSFGKEGFTYTLEENVLTVTAPSDEELGAFAQVWTGMGGETWTVDGANAAKA